MNLPELDCYLEWIPFENFKNVTYVTRGGFGKIYSANWAKDLFLTGILKCHYSMLWNNSRSNAKDYNMMVLSYCENGNLRNYYLNNKLDYYPKVKKSKEIVRGLLDIHNTGKVHKNFHSGNVLYYVDNSYISDLVIL
ncbi:hypothetical protein RhiirA1_473337 [Rhizophagus irregularis]|uniref:Protein kinase domain-containing protein n=1 Tax=Rhizophagus irregularis TaxID=588596 RepID=A0A2N0R0R8_9GLOM|nr:hypothetical protein RhiirA1_473337 [Rhizophagus irregularis]